MLRKTLVLSVLLGWALSGIAAAQEQRLPESPGFLIAGAGIQASETALSTVTGTVTDRAGAVVTGARVTLSDAGGRTQETETDQDGAFRFSAVAPGEFHVTAVLEGFVPGTAGGTTAAGGSAVAGPIVLSLLTVHQSVEVVATPEEIAAAQLQLEEKQRLVGILPNFFISYNWNALPLTSKQKFSLAWHNSLDPGNLLVVGITAGAQQADGGFPGDGQGAAGFGRRYGANLGNLVIGTYMGGAVLPSLFHQDPRYFYKGTGTRKSRLVYALDSAVRCRGDNGKRQIAWASMLGDLSAGAISNAYYAPHDRQGATLTIENGLLGIAGDAFNGLMQEFVLPRFTSKAKPVPANAP